MSAILTDLLKRFGIQSAAARQLFTDQAEIFELPKSTEIITEGKTNSSEYILISGILHRYNTTPEGENVTTGFYLLGSVITPHFARTRAGQNLFSLQTLTDVVLAAIPVSVLDQLRTTQPEFYAFGQRVVESELTKAVQLEVAYRTLPAKERLLAMRLQYPNLENQVPHPIIASYLGITPVSFSRLRHELAKA